ncbi:uncharacterized protein METZ01_LOCUS485713, partial [marine metagenome]
VQLKTTDYESPNGNSEIHLDSLMRYLALAGF